MYVAVLGCADLAVPEHAWHKRSGDVTTIGCKYQDKSWQLKCVGSKWNGTLGRCNESGKLHDTIT